MDIILSNHDVFVLFELVISICHIFSYLSFLGKLAKNYSFHGNQIMGIYGEFSRTKRSIDIPNGYISEQNGLF